MHAPKHRLVLLSRWRLPKVNDSLELLVMGEQDRQGV